jgi:GT2 family glycosyltransferase
VKPDLDASVIISTHNRAHYLDDVLGTLAAQNCGRSFEVIVIDNASSDDTAGVLESWCRRDSRFRTAYEARPGLSYGKNAGLRLARAPLLLFTDDDTLVDQNWIHAYLDLFARRGATSMIAGGKQIPIPHDLQPWPAWLTESAIENLALLDYGEEQTLAAPDYVWGANMAVPRHVFHQLGGWDETIGRKGHARGTFEDTEFQDRVRSAGLAVWFCPNAIIRHRVPRGSVTPRRVFASAFARGRNQLFRQHQVAPAAVEASRRNFYQVLFTLATNLVQWGLWVLAFRVVRRKSVFERARRAAYRCGRSLEVFHLGNSPVRLFDVIASIVLGWRKLLLRVSSDAA